MSDVTLTDKIYKAIEGLETHGHNIFRYLGGFDPREDRPRLPTHVQSAYNAWCLSDADDAYETAVLIAALQAWARDLDAK